MRSLATAVLLTCVALAADNPFVGTGAMNKSKSKIDPNGTQYNNFTIQTIQDGPTLKGIATVNGTAGPVTILDGKEHAISGSTPSGATHYVSAANGKTIKMVFNRDGKTVATRMTSLSADGKTMTSVTEGTWPNVFEKQ